ncbi:MAG: AcrR family transcriptional regulator [Myxococcota bacterium]|jgi:AcrR family transcriptional regulator
MSSDEPHGDASFSPRRVPTQRPGPSGGRRDQNRRMRTDALCRAGLDLFLARGIEGVTVDEIARAAGTAKGNFYRYVQDKEDLVAALLAPLEEEFIDLFAKCEADLAAADSVAAQTAAYTKMALELLMTVGRHRDVVRLYLQESRAPAEGARAPLSRFETWITERAIMLTRVAHKRGLLKEIAPEVSALAVLGAAERLLLAQLRDNAFDNEAQAVTDLIRLIMGGLS